MIEFYGTVSDTIARGLERLRRRYYALWLAALALLTAVVAVVAGIQSGLRGFLVPLICTAVLAAAAGALYFLPVKRQKGKLVLRVIVDADAGKLTVVQYLPGKEIKKERPLARVRRVYKSRFCYLLVFGDIGSAVVCERSLLKRGTFDLFEFVFSKKLQEKELFSAGKGI